MKSKRAEYRVSIGGHGGYYVGTSGNPMDYDREIFYSTRTPTRASHGSRFKFVSGPFPYKKCEGMIAGGLY